jgi:RNA polymerase sigma-70 factor (ECF subfamily)
MNARAPELAPRRPFPTDPTRLQRLSAVVRKHRELVERSLRRFGVPVADLDDAAQEVLIVAARRLDDFGESFERPFLVGTATRVASTRRRGARRRREEATGSLDDCIAPALDPERQSELALARPALRRILSTLSRETRIVFLLSELEELSAGDIAARLAIPVGTVGSRLRRARQEVRSAAKRLEAKERFAAGRAP